MLEEFLENKENKNNKASDLSVTFSIINSMVGAVILVIPISFKNSGIITSIITTFILFLIA